LQKGPPTREEEFQADKITKDKRERIRASEKFKLEKKMRPPRDARKLNCEEISSNRKK